MSRILTLAALSLISTSAHAVDETAWGAGIASIYIGSATPILNISVSNTSGDSDPDKRDLHVTSNDPAFSLDGQVFCQSVLGGEPRLVWAQVMFGTAVAAGSGNGTMLWTIGVWDESDPIVFGGQADAADVSFDHQVDLPETWNGGIYFGFNPVETVEARLATYVENGGTASDFLRTDDVFEVDVSVNLAAKCEVDDDGHLWEYEGYTRRTITASIFYNGDPNIEDEITVVEPPSNDVLFDLDEQIVLTVASAKSRSEGRAKNQTRDDRTVSYDRFPMFDDVTGQFTAVWAGVVTYTETECSDTAVSASTSDGTCVWVEGCMPQEFGSCREVDGCCDVAPSVR